MHKTREQLRVEYEKDPGVTDEMVYAFFASEAGEHIAAQYMNEGFALEGEGKYARRANVIAGECGVGLLSVWDNDVMATYDWLMK